MYANVMLIISKNKSNMLTTIKNGNKKPSLSLDYPFISDTNNLFLEVNRITLIYFIGIKKGTRPFF